MKRIRLLVACETSGEIRRRLRQRGFDAWSVDVLPSEDNSRHHIVADALEIVRRGWHGLIGHPPCTRLCNSGVRWLAERNLWHEMEQAAGFFRALWIAKIPYIALENPIPHGYAVDKIGAKYSQIIQPWQFGHGETKATCWWLKGFPPLVPTKIVDGRVPRVHHASPGPDRWRERSRTYSGIAEAVATQWGNFLLERL